MTYAFNNTYLKNQFCWDLNAAGLRSSSGQDTIEINNHEESSDEVQEAQELLVSCAGFVMCELHRKPHYELEVRMCLTHTETKISIAGKAHSITVDENDENNAF